MPSTLPASPTHLAVLPSLVPPCPFFLPHQVSSSPPAALSFPPLSPFVALLAPSLPCSWAYYCFSTKLPSLSPSPCECQSSPLHQCRRCLSTLGQKCSSRKTIQDCTYPAPTAAGSIMLNYSVQTMTAHSGDAQQTGRHSCYTGYSDNLVSICQAKYLNQFFRELLPC